MPFKSEAQRRYLWAREPKIARDWTDTYGSRIQKENGGITRLGFQNGNNVDEEETFLEWLKSMGIETKDWARQLSGMAVGALSKIPGAGFLLNAARPSPIDEYNRARWSVHGRGLPGTRHVTSIAPMNYYNTLRHGNLTGQDPFGVNVASLFGNYQKHYEDYLTAFNRGEKKGKFARDKAGYAKQVLGITPSSSNIAGTPLVTQASEYRETGGGKDFQPQRPSKPGGFTDPGKGSYGPHKAYGGRIDKPLGGRSRDI